MKYFHISRTISQYEMKTERDSKKIYSLAPFYDGEIFSEAVAMNEFLERNSVISNKNLLRLYISFLAKLEAWIPDTKSIQVDKETSSNTRDFMIRVLTTLELVCRLLNHFKLSFDSFEQKTINMDEMLDKHPTFFEGAKKGQRATPYFIQDTHRRRW